MKRPIKFNQFVLDIPDQSSSRIIIDCRLRWSGSFDRQSYDPTSILVLVPVWFDRSVTFLAPKAFILDENSSWVTNGWAISKIKRTWPLITNNQRLPRLLARATCLIYWFLLLLSLLRASRLVMIWLAGAMGFVMTRTTTADVAGMAGTVAARIPTKFFFARIAFAWNLRIVTNGFATLPTLLLFVNSSGALAWTISIHSLPIVIPNVY